VLRGGQAESGPQLGFQASNGGPWWSQAPWELANTPVCHLERTVASSDTSVEIALLNEALAMLRPFSRVKWIAPRSSTAANWRPFLSTEPAPKQDVGHPARSAEGDPGAVGQPGFLEQAVLAVERADSVSRRR